MSLWTEHMTTIGQFFERPKSLEYVRQMSVFGEHNWLQYTADEVTEMRGHLLKNPVEIDRTGKVKLFHGGHGFKPWKQPLAEMQEYLKLNPLAYVPTLVEGDAVTVDSFAIIMVWFSCTLPFERVNFIITMLLVKRRFLGQYLEEKYPQRALLPQERKQKITLTIRASMARSLDTGVPWVVCQHPYAPTAPCLITFSEAPSSKEGQ
ncbi:putative U-box domain-containing protein 26-like [Capsicum annuum]|nr:putative U-box domain-containing protein 26-like [Capsicum annuum]KAF3657975.1 putative U-box domain-containing protein 26-like [Capsicum annuum]